MNYLRKITVFAVLLLLNACSGELRELPSGSVAGPVEVGVSVKEGPGISMEVKSAGGDGLSTVWEDGDAISLWGIRDDGTSVLTAQPFTCYGVMDGAAFFTSSLIAPMPEGKYTYYLTYPAPVSYSGLDAVFRVPAGQDGKSGSGEDIMVSVPVRHGPLLPIDWSAAGHDGASFRMSHLLHRLRFYTEDPRLDGEPVQRIVATFPRNVAGLVNVDLKDPGISSVSAEGSNVITVNAGNPVPVSGPGVRNYITASIVPTSFSDGESMQLRLYTETKVADVTIPLQSRTFAAGHSTPVRIIPQSVGNHCKIYFDVLSNNLGEKVDRITLSAPEGCRWGDSTGNTLVVTPEGGIEDRYAFVLEYDDESAFRTLSGKAITVTYDSEHVAISEKLTVPDLNGRLSARLSLNVPYLLYEDFSTVPSFSSNDNYGTSSAGSKSAYSFLSGWTGGRVGAEAGKCIRIACRRETSADYDARVDSAPLRGTLKKPSDISVEFDYGADNQFGGIPIIVDGNVGQTCYIGYVTGTGGYNSGATDGTFESDNSFYVKEYTGTYDNTPNNDSYVIHSAPSGGTVRISWRTEVEHQAGTTNTTAWLYIDNVKVRIANK